MRILHILRAPMGGVLRHVRDLSLAQTNLGYDVGIICDVPGTDGYNEETLTMLSANLALGVLRVPMSRSVGLGDISTMRKVSSLI
ncbi:MAG: glycosyltransferase family 1 protein, partial [Pseudomonadota bacterium]